MATKAEKQSAGRTAVSILGALIGTLSQLFVYPQAMEVYGLAIFLLQTTLTFAPFILLGGSVVAINNFPEFKTDDRKDHGFFGLIFGIYILGSVLFCISFFLGEKWFSHLFASPNPAYNVYFMSLIPLGILQAGCLLLETYLSNLTKVIIPAFLKETLIKITLPLLILLHIMGYLSVDGLVWGLFLNYVVALGMMIAYVYYLRRPKLSIDLEFVDAKKRKHLAQYSFFAILTVLGTQLVNNLDIFMIKAILPPFEVITVYYWHFTMANFIIFPNLAIVAVATPMVTAHIKDGNWSRVKELYKKTANMQFLMGSFIFFVILINLNYVYELMPNGSKYTVGYYIFLFLGLAKLMDMVTGMNTQIIVFSKYYRFNLYGMIIVGLVNFVLSYWLIHSMGIVGAALSTFISLTIFNIIKLLYIKTKFGFTPFSATNLKILTFSILLAFVIYILPLSFIPLINLACKGILFTILYWFIALKYQFEPQINDLYNQNIIKWTGHDRFTF